MRTRRALAGLMVVTLSWPVSVAAQDGPMCLTEPADIVGTEGPDRLEGTPKRDVIVGLGGDDVIVGLGGSDVICGGPDDDSIYGGREQLLGTDDGSSDDHLFGDDGNDLLRGASAMLRGGTGDDVLMYGKASFLSAANGVVVDLAEGTATGQGQDELVEVRHVVGSPYADSISGNDEPNSFSAQAGDDVVNGRGGSDYLFGQGGNDSLAGGGGDDHDLWGGPDDDTITGGPGGDTLTGDGYLTEVAEFGDDVLDGGGGSDEVTYHEGVVVSVTIDLRAGTASGHGEDLLSGFETIVGSDGNDVIQGDANRNNIMGMWGEDEIRGGKGGDWLNATGPLGYSREGEDDELFGGAGDDRFYIHDCCTTLEVIGGPGIDLADFYSTDKDNFLVAHLGGMFEMKRNVGVLLEIENLSGIHGTDRIFGDEGPNVIRGLTGRDQLSGGGGDDRLVGGRGHDVIDGDEGRDTCKGVNDRRHACERG